MAQDMNNMMDASSSKRVRFCEYSDLFITEPKREEEPTWYTREDISDFKKNARLTSRALRKTKTAKLMQHIAYSAASKSPDLNDVRVHSREFICGIEHLISPEVTKSLLLQRKKTIQRVLDIQAAQKAGILHADPNSAATVSEINSSFSKEWCKRITHFQHGARCA